MSNFVMLVGLPGCGKSTVANQFLSTHHNEYVWLSSDKLREELWGDEEDQSNPGAIFNAMNNRAVAALNEGYSVIYDATNLNSKKRKATLAEITRRVNPAKSDFIATCYVVTCSITECKQRQNLRSRKVSDEVIDRMARQFQTPNYGEGWDKIFIISNGKKQDLVKEMNRLRETPHDNPHHSTGSIAEHCVRALSNIKELAEAERIPDPYIRLLEDAAYYHDIGKRKTKVFHDKEGNPTDVAHYYGHDNMSAYLWLSGDQWLGKWNDSCTIEIANLIQWHMISYFLTDKSKEGLAAWCEKKGFNELFARGLWVLHEADRLAH